jgi:hypothetical protein
VGTSKPSVVDIKVSQSAGSKASLADVGLSVPVCVHYCRTWYKDVL